MKELESAAVANEMEQNTGVDFQRAGKYLTFKLADEEYGLEILKVKEIIGLMNITKVPQTPESVRGVINLRGKVIPVTDLRVKFSMEKIEDTNATCIIVVDVSRNRINTLIGILVDSVSEVMEIREDEIEDAPAFGAEVNTDYILGMSKTKDKVIMLLDINRVLIEENFEPIFAGT